MPLHMIAMIGMLVMQADSGRSVEIARSYRIQSGRSVRRA